MKFTLELFIADDKINRFMEAGGVKPEYKWFVIGNKISFERDTIDHDFIMKIINVSYDEKPNNDFWIPAIGFQETLYTHQSVKSLGFVEDGMEAIIHG